MDAYLQSGPRTQEWFPAGIPNLLPLSRTECLDDLELANMHSMLELDDPELESAAQMYGSRSQNSRYLKRKQQMQQNKTQEQEVMYVTPSTHPQYAHALSPPRISLSLYVCLYARRHEEGGPSKRQHLQYKIEDERSVRHSHMLSISLHPHALTPLSISLHSARLDNIKTSGFQLRQQLDQLRSETQSYEDAIAQTRRDIELIQREKEMSVNFITCTQHHTVFSLLC